MSQLIPKRVDDVHYHVRRLTVREIYRLFDQREEAPPLDLLGNTLFEELTLEDILTFTDLSREQLLDLLPTDVETIIAEIKQENPHFFRRAPAPARDRRAPRHAHESDLIAFKRTVFILIRLGHTGVWDYAWGEFLDAIAFENHLASKEP